MKTIDVPKLTTPVGRHDTARTGMESSSIGTLVIDTLENVEFTTERPVEGINLPDRGPGATPLRHMADIESIKTK